MFQVASHPSSFDAPHMMHQHQSPHAHHIHHNYQAPPHSPTIQLPRTLARPPFAEVSRDAIMAAAPELLNVPVEYIRRGLTEKALQMVSGTSALSPSHLPKTMARSQIPSHLTIPLRQPTTTCKLGASYPTHVVAVSSSKSASHADPLSLFPIHAIVLASHCAKIPPLPPAMLSTPGSVCLPVLPLVLPSATAFSLLHSYMYNHKIDYLLSCLLPFPSWFLRAVATSTNPHSSSSSGSDSLKEILASPQDMRSLSSYLAENSEGSLQAITVHAAHVKELWQDCVALGMGMGNSIEIWDALDVAWEVVLGAMALTAGNQ